VILRQVNTHVDDATVLAGEHVEATVFVQIEAGSFCRLQAVDFASGGTVEKRFLVSPSWGAYATAITLRFQILAGLMKKEELTRLSKSFNLPAQYL
jgi:hypothetical protein